MNDLSFSESLNEVYEQLDNVLNNFEISPLLEEELISIRDIIHNLINSPELNLFNEMIGVMEDVESEENILNMFDDIEVNEE